ncbi:reticulon-like protein b1 [Phtheirospermum japonicum]|uniref:Reticulon-like protein b1 n=1 Tax=Phtheirospermum japonicum TaxID=374723 RepID=A0A830CE12_9LAMI|nr:reticulon-like protein b1 [Phtheirospermum japonicum]
MELYVGRLVLLTFLILVNVLGLLIVVGEVKSLEQDNVENELSFVGLTVFNCLIRGDSTYGHVLPCRPSGVTLDIKKSSHKKLSKWLQSKASNGLKLSAGLLGGATAIWILFDVLEYHVLSFVCHDLVTHPGSEYSLKNGNGIHLCLEDCGQPGICGSEMYLHQGRDLKKFLSMGYSQTDVVFFVSTTSISEERMLFLSIISDASQLRSATRFLFLVLVRLNFNIFGGASS